LSKSDDSERKRKAYCREGGTMRHNMKVSLFAAICIVGILCGCKKNEPYESNEIKEEAASSVMNISLFGGCFSDQNNGWLVGKLGIILHTTNGGKTWSVQQSGKKLHLYDVSFCNANDGLAVGENGFIIHTTNGGMTWEPQLSGITGNLRGVHFIDSAIAWVVGHEGAVLKTNDGGKTWTKHEAVEKQLKVMNRQFPPSLFSVKFSDTLHGFVVGHPGIILCTTNGGETWEKQSSGTNAVLYKVETLDSKKAWVTGGEGVILHTDDGGKTWNIQNSGVNFKLNSVSFINEKNGFVVGYKCILQTEDGGETWLKTDISLPRWFYDIDFSDANNGWAIGDSGTIYHTHDGGKNWNLEAVKIDAIP